MQINIKQLYIYMDYVRARPRSHQSSRNISATLIYFTSRFILYGIYLQEKQTNKQV